MVWDKSFWRPANLIVTWFGVGHLPKIPGTWGSLAALPLAWLIVINYGQTWLCLAALILFIIGTVIYFIYTGKIGHLISFLRSILPNLLKLLGI